MVKRHKAEDSASAPETSKGGRPRKLDDTMYAFVKSHFGLTNDRAVLEHFYRIRALRIAFDATKAGVADLRWLADQGRMMANAKNSWRPILLSDLGRIEDDEELIAAAKMLCQVKPSAKRGRAMLRGTKPHSADALRGAIAKAIADYSASHPSVTLSEIRDALYLAASAA